LEEQPVLGLQNGPTNLWRVLQAADSESRREEKVAECDRSLLDHTLAEIEAVLRNSKVLMNWP
jgi:chorismate-pyruvate lyase